MIGNILRALAFPAGTPLAVANRETRQRLFVAVSAVVIAPVLILFCYLEYVRGTPLMMYLTGGGAILVLSTLALLRSQRFSLLAPRITIGFCTLILVTQILEDRGQHALFWPFVIPVVSMFLFGRWEGLIWALALFGVTAPMVLFPEWFGLTVMEGAAEDYIPGFLVITAFSFGYETLNRLSHREAIGKARALAAERDALEKTRASLEQTVKELEDARARERDFAETASDWFFELDRDLRFASISNAWQRITGIPVESVLGRFIGSLGNFFSDETVDEDVFALLREGRSLRDVRLDMPGADGRRLHLEVNCRPVYDADGRITGFRGSGTNITHAIEAQSELEAQKAALVQADKMTAVGQLTSGIAHDFNNLLTVVRGNLDLLRDDISSEDNLELLEQADAAAVRAAELTSRMLAFSRRQALAPQPIAVSEVMGEIAPLLRHALSPKATLRMEMPPTIWDCLADRAQLESALLNLVINAKDAMDSSGDVIVKASNQSRSVQTIPDDASRDLAATSPSGDLEYVCFEVIDTGSGISAEDLQRIFEPFFTTKSAGKGTGLGLSMVYGFAYQSGGFLEVDSEPGRGTRMRLFLPRTMAASDMRPASVVASVSDWQEKSLLLVEDDFSLRKLMISMLTGLGFKVTAVDSAVQARRALMKFTPDIVCTDIMLDGDASGMDLARELKDRCPVLLMTGWSEEVLDPDLAEFPLLRKPFGREELAEALNQLSQRSEIKAG